MAEYLLGTEAFLANLRQRGSFARAALAQALSEGGDVMLAAQQSRCPELSATVPGSSALPKGALKASLRKRRRSTKTDNPQVLIGPSGKAKLIAIDVEFGHASVNASGTAGRDVPAHPFLRPAYEGAIGETRETIRQSMRRQWEERGGK